MVVSNNMGLGDGPSDGVVEENVGLVRGNGVEGE